MKLTGKDEIYAAAARFVDSCLRRDDSLFTPGRPIWSPPNLDELHARFVMRPDTSTDAFEAKFRRQLADAPGEVIQLAAEILYVHFLVASRVSGEAKRWLINRVSSWSRTPAAIPPDLDRVLEGGLAAVGPAFHIHRPNQLWLLIDFGRAWKQLAPAERDRLLADAWAFKQFLFSVPVNSAQSQREALLHLVHPDTFEPIVSREMKKAIAAKLGTAEAASRDVDVELLQIREALSPRFGPSFRFWDDGVAKLWRDGDTDRPSSAHPASDVLLVGAADVENDLKTCMPLLELNGRAAVWWSFPLRGERRATLDSSRHLYLYVGKRANAVVSQEITHRYHVVDYRTQSGVAGMASPWPEDTPEVYRDKTRIGPGPHEVFKTWLLIDRVEPLDPPVRLKQVVDAEGRPANPGALRGGFALWRRRGAPAGLEELAGETCLTTEELVELEGLVTEKKQVILEGPPGSGKTYVAEKFARYFTKNPLTGELSDPSALRVIQFHQSYAYEDFVQGIRPVTDGSSQIQYRVQKGVFRLVCEVAAANPGRRFVILIDEINRGNISRILGELLLLLEYRSLKVPLLYDEPDAALFSVPENVYIIGTMNTTDRSLAQVDYALRRRFYFYRMMPSAGRDAPVLRRWLESHRELPNEARSRVLDLFLRLNERVEGYLGEHFQVGHSYFMVEDIGTEDGLKRVWRHAVMPLLEEYFYGHAWDQRRKEFVALLAESHTETPNQETP